MNEAALKAHLQSLEEALITNEVRNNPARIKELLAESFFEFGSSGRVFSYEDCVDGLGKADMELSHFAMRLLTAEVAHVTFQTYNKKTQQQALRSSIWQKFNEEWKMVFHQGTKTCD
ncbi:DUF4440 domain-containing protein [Shouchella lonarensis]|uniref:DUF4440 domain-containing protein n=1 Tax=Shouchella lonarensis TaxID=1464122 RepID=A0A1G6NAA4_9BACI|nr:DUF4440 domain-containing protein [Shouchella lonarensis]SDC64792.1 hypothetical protein SAMN05421737_11227 [Shouchella lonarensis]